jgi:xylan 1,4-beta-xylosidase
MEFEPECFQQMAGLVCYYNESKFHYLFISHDAELGKHIRIMSCLPDQPQSDVFTPPVPIPAGSPVSLRVEVDKERLYFAYRVGTRMEWLPGAFDASILSDEAGLGNQNLQGHYQDVPGSGGSAADYDHFLYGNGYRPNPKAAIYEHCSVPPNAAS